MWFILILLGSELARGQYMYDDDSLVGDSDDTLQEVDLYDDDLWDSLESDSEEAVGSRLLDKEASHILEEASSPSIKHKSEHKSKKKTSEANLGEDEFAIDSLDGLIDHQEKKTKADQAHLQNLIRSFNDDLNHLDSVETEVGDSEEEMLGDDDELDFGHVHDFDIDAFLEEAVGDAPIAYQRWYEKAMSEFKDIEADLDDLEDIDDRFNDFKETLVGDPYEELHADMNDMFENILFHDDDDHEIGVGDMFELYDDDLNDY